MDKSFLKQLDMAHKVDHKKEQVCGYFYDRAILSNADVLPSTPLSSIWKNDFWGTAINSSNSHGSYRPVSIISFRLNYLISGFKPWSYHAVNVCLHAIATYLVYALGRVILPPPAHITAALLFAVHPVHCEAIASVVGRADILASIFFLLSFLCYIEHVGLRNSWPRQPDVRLPARRFCYKRATTHNGVGRYRFYDDEDDGGGCGDQSDKCIESCGIGWLRQQLSWWLKMDIYMSELQATSNSFQRLYAIGEWISLGLTLVLAALAMFSKETGVTVLAVCASYDVVKTWSFKYKRRQLYRSLSILTVTLCLLLILRFYITDGYAVPTFASSDNPTAKERSVLTRALTFLYLPVFNFLLLVYPLKLSFDWSMDAIPRVTSILDARNALTVLFYTTAFNCAKKCARRVLKERSTSSKQLCKGCRLWRLRRVVVANKTPQNGVIKNGGLKNGSLKNGSLKNGYTNGHTNGHTNGLLLNGHTNGAATAKITRCECRVTRDVGGRHAFEVYAICLSLLVLPFLPATNLFFYVGFVVAERVLYIPSVGYCFLVAVAHELLERRVNFKHFRVLFSVLIIVFSVRTLLRNKDWHNEEALYRSGIEVNPPKAYANLGSILSSQGRVEEAEQALKTALRYRPTMADAHYNLGILQQGKAQYEEAINSYKEAIRLRPSLALAHLNLGQLLASRGLCEEAETVLRHCSKLDSTGVKDPKLHETTRISALLHLGRLLADRGRYGEAISIYKEAVHSLPEYYQPQVLYNLLGEALTHMGHHVEAERWHKAAMQAKPDHIPTHLIYGKLLAKNRTRVAEAEEKFLEAQKLAPRDPAVHQHFGQFLSQIQRYSEAASQYLEALKLAPSEYELALGAATAFRQAGHNQQAEQLYRQAVSLKPMEPGAHINLGAMLHLNGKFKDAAICYQTALKLNPNDQMALQNLNKLRAFLRKN